MFRSLIGFAVFAVVGIFLLKVLFGVFGLVVSLLMTVLWFACIGFALYILLRIISPSTADRVKEAINGKSAA